MTPEQAEELLRTFAALGEECDPRDREIAHACTVVLCQLEIARERADRAEAWRFMVEGGRVYDRRRSTQMPEKGRDDARIPDSP